MAAVVFARVPWVTLAHSIESTGRQERPSDRLPGAVPTLARVSSTPRVHLSDLGLTAVELEKHVASAGWDQPARLFALVDTTALREQEPSLAEQLADDSAAWTAIEQEDLPAHNGIEQLLAQIAWPDQVGGTALSIERIVVPPSAEADMPSDPDEAATYLADHPERKDVRLLAAVLRDGEQICLLRQRDHDEDDAVAMGANIAPGLVQALLSTLNA